MKTTKGKKRKKKRANDDGTTIPVASSVECLFINFGVNTITDHVIRPDLKCSSFPFHFVSLCLFFLNSSFHPSHVRCCCDYFPLTFFLCVCVRFWTPIKEPNGRHHQPECDCTGREVGLVLGVCVSSSTISSFPENLSRFHNSSFHATGALAKNMLTLKKPATALTSWDRSCQMSQRQKRRNEWHWNSRGSCSRS